MQNCNPNQILVERNNDMAQTKTEVNPTTSTSSANPISQNPDAIYTQPGYITSMQVIPPSKYENLPGEFSWQHIPMFSVITGKNGTGKSKILEAILFGFEESSQQIQLDFHGEKPQICSFRNTGTISSLRQSVEKSSKKILEEKSDTIFEDLKKYVLFKQLGKAYTLKFKDNESFYNLVIQKSLTSIEKNLNFSFQSYETELKKYFDRESETHFSEYNSLEKQQNAYLKVFFMQTIQIHKKKRKKV